MQLCGKPVGQDNKINRIDRMEIGNGWIAEARQLDSPVWVRDGRRDKQQRWNGRHFGFTLTRSS